MFLYIIYRSFLCLPNLTPGGYRLVLLNFAIDPSVFDERIMVRRITAAYDYLYKYDALRRGLIFLADLEEFSLAHLLKMPITRIQKYVQCALVSTNIICTSN